jgi:hypothetical protein
VSIDTACQWVSSLDQRVTQWMSAVTFSCGSACISSQVQDFSVSPPCLIENVQFSVGVRGVGPADSTGKSWVTYWPGGTRLSSPAGVWWRRWKPRDNGGLMPSSPPAGNKKAEVPD